MNLFMLTNRPDLKISGSLTMLNKALYGLKQAPRVWYERLRDFLIMEGFKIGKVDMTLFTKDINGELFICEIYVDDIIFGCTNEKLSHEFGDMMSREFEMSMIGELNFFLASKGRNIHPSRKILQRSLKKFKMDDCKPIETPMSTREHLDADVDGKSVDQSTYRSMIGSLLYLTASRPDIMFGVCLCARFQAAPKESHLMVVKRILQYLKHTPSIGAWYPEGANKKQNCVALSTAEAEYIAAGACCAQILYMKQSLLDFGIVCGSVPLLCDNERAVKIAKNLVQHSHTKHIDIRHHFLHDHEAKGDIILTGVRSKEQLADIFTKPLDESTFVKLRSELNVLDLSNVMPSGKAIQKIPIFVKTVLSALDKGTWTGPYGLLEKEQSKEKLGTVWLNMLEWTIRSMEDNFSKENKELK
ncbi:LOW QUALITY PROTEIN: hypothetical protein U9M48_030851 [Paspalum notatum var. saurae]|uniref:Reverse transcriptase Ty1/copia-type domain-containing protein n=1 Tax=Paspalum notatum var. saurae TaxID=547442 RepID=A0AAQ3U5M2_PASNO